MRRVCADSCPAPLMGGPVRTVTTQVVFLRRHFVDRGAVRGAGSRRERRRGYPPTTCSLPGRPRRPTRSERGSPPFHLPSVTAGSLPGGHLAANVAAIRFIFPGVSQMHRPPSVVGCLVSHEFLSDLGAAILSRPFFISHDFNFSFAPSIRSTVPSV